MTAKQKIEALIRIAKRIGTAAMSGSLIDRGLTACLDLFRKLKSVLLIKKYPYWKEIAFQLEFYLLSCLC